MIWLPNSNKRLKFLIYRDAKIIFLIVNVSVNVYGKKLNIFFDFLYNYILYSRCSVFAVIKDNAIVQF
jgi:hypothetical protein